MGCGGSFLWFWDKKLARLKSRAYGVASASPVESTVGDLSISSTGMVSTRMKQLAPLTACHHFMRL
jgi:hypothetical protein